LARVTGERKELLIRRWALGTPAVHPHPAPKLFLAAVLFVMAMSVPMMPVRIVAGVLSALVLVWTATASALGSVPGLASWAERGRTAQPRASLVATPRGLYREDESSAILLCEWGIPFGVSWLVGKDAMLAFTTSREVRCVRVRLVGASMNAIEQVKRAGSPMTDSGFEVLSESASLDAEDALEVVRYCEQISPRSSLRVLASGLRGERVLLEGQSLLVRGGGLEVNDRSFDLSLPLEWRTSVFHEAAGASAMLFSALVVRQQGAEVVFVSPAQGDLNPPFDGPPARESRVAIDALLLSPIRRALSRAPRIRRSSPSAPRGPREQTA
jgi:hypothetical protein